MVKLDWTALQHLSDPHWKERRRRKKDKKEWFFTSFPKFFAHEESHYTLGNFSDTDRKSVTNVYSTHISHAPGTHLHAHSIYLWHLLSIMRQLLTYSVYPCNWHARCAYVVGWTVKVVQECDILEHKIKTTWLKKQQQQNFTQNCKQYSIKI